MHTRALQYSVSLQNFNAGICTWYLFYYNLFQDIKGEMGVGQRSLPMDPSSMYGQGIIQSKSGIGSAGNYLLADLAQELF